MQPKIIYDSEKRPPPAIEELSQLIKYRDLVFQLVRRDLVSRYKRSVLGVAWTLLNPLGTMLIMSIVFSKVFNRTQNYSIYVLSGLLIWNFISQTTQHSMASLIWGSKLLNKIYIPRTAFIVSSISTGMINLLLSLIPLFLIMLIKGVSISASIFLLPVVFMFLALFALGAGLLLSAYSIVFPDISEMYGIVLRAWIYLSPVIVPVEVLEEFLNGVVLKINPLYYFITFFRDTVYGESFPSITLMLSTAGISISFFTLGWLIYTHKSDKFSYYI